MRNYQIYVIEPPQKRKEEEAEKSENHVQLKKSLL